MSDWVECAKRLQEAIRQVLLREWDPIGVADVPQAQDEYDSYISQIYGLLIRREPKQKLIDFLWWVETEHMQLYGNRGRAERVAELLMQLNGNAESEPP